MIKYINFTIESVRVGYDINNDDFIKSDSLDDHWTWIEDNMKVKW